MLSFYQKWRCCAILFVTSFLCVSFVQAMNYKDVAFEGSLSSVPIPSNWVYEYQALGDVVVVGDGTTQGFLLSIGPNEAPEDYLSSVVREMNASALIDKIQKIKIGGYDAAIIDNFGIVHEKYVAIKKAGALLIVYGTTKDDPLDLQKHLELLAEKTEFYPSKHPEKLAGSYVVDATEDPSYVPTLDMGMYQERVTLNSSGAFGDLGFGENDAVKIKNSEYLLGSWVQRGNRLIIEENNRHFVNYRLQTTSSGLTLIDQDGIRKRWVKQ